MSRILVLIPSLNREDHLADCIKSLLVTAQGPFDLLVLTAPGGVYKAVNAVPHELLRQYDIIGVRDDDSRMRAPGWVNRITCALKDRIGMVYGKDGMMNESLATHPFFSAEIPLALGYVYPPEFEHYAGDNYLHELTNAAGILRFLPELVTEHLHPWIGKGEVDETYRASFPLQEADGKMLETLRKTRLPSDLEKLKALIMVV